MATCLSCTRFKSTAAVWNLDCSALKREVCSMSNISPSVAGVTSARC